MAVVERTRLLTEHGLAELRRPRQDICVEEPDGPDAWTFSAGPFRRYRRTLSVDPAPANGSDTDGIDRTDGASEFRVTERVDYKLALPLWWPYLWLLMRRAVIDDDRTPRRRWWWPQEVVTAETSTMIAHLGTIGMMAGFMGVMIGQTITFAAEDFGVADDVQANTLAAVRIGVLLSFLFLGLADRIGRRPLLLAFAAGAIVFTIAGAASPSMLALGGSQTVARGLTTGLLTLITLASTEEVPASSRALSISFMTLTTGFGAASVIWILPVADVVDGGWRIIYLVPVVFIPLLWWVSRNLPETRRFTAADVADSDAAINWRRFAMIAATGLLSAIFLSPASQLRNEFLRDDMDFSAGQVSTFQLMISVPATMAIPLAGVVADRRGRKYLGGGLLGASAIMTAISYQSTGLLLWITAGLGVTLAAGAVPALRGYQTELFPTRARGRVGGMLDVLVVTGSAIGLVAVGQLSIRWDDLGAAIGIMLAFPLIAALIILFFFPETANRELEDFNPGDPTLPPDASRRGQGP